MIVHLSVTPELYVAGTHLYTWMNREKVDSEVPCLRKQRDGRGLNPCVRARPHTPPLKIINQILNIKEN